MELRSKPEALPGTTESKTLRSADTSEFVPPSYSVTEGTTKHLSSSGPKQ
jgi:hypothetical protein